MNYSTPCYIGEYQHSERKDPGSEGLGDATWGCGAVEMYVSETWDNVSVLRVLDDIGINCRYNQELYTHMLLSHDLLCELF